MGTTIRTEGKATINAFIKANAQILKKLSTNPIFKNETTPDIIKVIKVAIQNANTKNSYFFGIKLFLHT